MGLDMYLYRNFSMYAGTNKETLNAKKEQIKAIFPELFLSNEHSIEIHEVVAYWRKANAIHNWMVQNVQDGNDDCYYHYVSIEQIQTLRDLAEKALHSKTPEEILPTLSGFFFGSTEYDDSYREDMSDTVKQLDKVLAIHKQTAEAIKNSGIDYYVEYEYISSW